MTVDELISILNEAPGDFTIVVQMDFANLHLSRSYIEVHLDNSLVIINADEASNDAEESE